MANYASEQLLTSVLSTCFYSTKVVDDAVDALSAEISGIIDGVSSVINPKLGIIADEISAQVKKINNISSEVNGLTKETSDLTAVYAQLSGITQLPTNGSIAISAIVEKVNEIVAKFSVQS